MGFSCAGDACAGPCACVSAVSELGGEEEEAEAGWELSVEGEEGERGSGVVDWENLRRYCTSSFWSSIIFLHSSICFCKEEGVEEEEGWLGSSSGVAWVSLFRITSLERKRERKEGKGE